MKFELNDTTKFGCYDLQKNTSKDGKSIPVKVSNQTNQRLKSIEDRLTTLENSPTSSSSGAETEKAIREYQMQVLSKLKKIRESLVNEIGDVNTIKSERDIALEENIKLKKEVDKLNYRITILIRSLNEEEAKHAKSV